MARKAAAKKVAKPAAGKVAKKAGKRSPLKAAKPARSSRSRSLGAKGPNKPAPAAVGAVHHVKASSFADPDDVAAFKKCKAQGKTDEQCFKVGDNGIGFAGDDCTGPTPMCALPQEDWKERWGTKANARLKPVVVTANGKPVVCLLGATMPKRATTPNGAGIDLSPAAVKAIGKKPPLMIDATWIWQADH